MATISTPVLLFCERLTNFPLIIIIFSLSSSLPDIFVLYFHTLCTSLYVSPTSLPVWVPWNYVCAIHGPLSGLHIYRCTYRRVFCLYFPLKYAFLPQLAIPHPSTRVVRLGTHFFIYLLFILCQFLCRSMCIYSHWWSIQQWKLEPWVFTYEMTKKEISISMRFLGAPRQRINGRTPPKY